MPVTVGVVTLPIDLAVRLVAEPSTVQSVAGTERLPPRKIRDGTWRHGRVLILNLVPRAINRIL